MKINKLRNRERKIYRVMLQDRYTAEVREINVEAINRDHAKIKAQGQAEIFEFIVSIQEEEIGQAKTDRKNREHCRRIAEDVEAYTEGRVHRCPECNNIVEIPDSVGNKYRCPECGTTSDIEDFEQLSLWDYMEDILDIEYRISSDRETVRSVQIMVTCGGPNIYIDTATRNVELYWWGDRASYPISYDTCDALDEWAQELWGC